MRILFVFQSPEYVRNYESTLRELNREKHVIFLSSMPQKKRDNPMKRARLDPTGWGLSIAHNVGAVPCRKGRVNRIKHRLRGIVDFLRFLHPDYAMAVHLRERMKLKSLDAWLSVLDKLPTLPPRLLRGLVSALCRLDAALPTDRLTLDFLRGHEPDLVVVTPLVVAASPQVEVVHAAKELNIPVAVCIASWDNLTNKGLLKCLPDKVFVWNADQRREAARYHYVPRERVEITGAPLFDRWFDARPEASYESYCRTTSLHDDRPYVLYVGSSNAIAPNDDEILFVQRWIRALRTSGSELLRNAGVLIRPHPYNYFAWESVDLEMLENVSIWPRSTPVLASESNQQDLFHAIFHSAAVVGINTSVMIEAAIIGRRVFTIETEEFARGQRETLHFNYLLSEQGGIATAARNLDEHCRQLERALDDGQDAPDYTAFIERFVRPAGLRQSASRVLAAKLVDLGEGTESSGAARQREVVPV
ncbi:MAG: hypothetical protein WB783_01015 [Arenicellales bacterium]